MRVGYTDRERQKVREQKMEGETEGDGEIERWREGEMKRRERWRKGETMNDK